MPWPCLTSRTLAPSDAELDQSARSEAICAMPARAPPYFHVSLHGISSEDHVRVVCRSGRLSTTIRSLPMPLHCRTSPIILHFAIQLLLGLLRSRPTFPSASSPSSSATPAAVIPSRAGPPPRLARSPTPTDRRPRVPGSRHVAVYIQGARRRRLARTIAAIASPAVTRLLHPVEHAAGRFFHAVE